MNEQDRQSLEKLVGEGAECRLWFSTGAFSDAFVIDPTIHVQTPTDEEPGLILYFIPSISYTGNVHSIEFDEIKTLLNTSGAPYLFEFYMRGTKVAEIAEIAPVDTTYPDLVSMREWHKNQGAEWQEEHRQTLLGIYEAWINWPILNA